MRKVFLTVVASVVLAAATFSSAKKANATCYGCWVGGAFAAGVVGGAILANRAYGYGYYGGYGYAPYYGYGYAPTYYGYSYAPSYSYGYAPYNYGYGASYYYPRRAYYGGYGYYGRGAYYGRGVDYGRRAYYGRHYGRRVVHRRAYW